MGKETKASKKDKSHEKHDSNDTESHKHKSSKSSKKKELKLPPEFALGARVEILEHEVESMRSRKGLSLGAFKATDSPRKRVMIAVKLEGIKKKGSSVDVSFVSSVPHLRKV